MLKCFNFDIVCQEIPDEISLALNISGCPNHCDGCHSPWLWEEMGDDLTDEHLISIIEPYGSAVTCVCFMGGDQDPAEITRLATIIRSTFPDLKTGWYSGRKELPDGFDTAKFDYIKLGPYVKSLGGLRSPNTNQRLYRILSDSKKEIIRFSTKNG